MENKSQKGIIHVLYILLILSTVLSFVPNLTAPLLSLALTAFVLMAGYWYKNSDQENGLLYNHMTYLIGTIWMGTTLIVIGMVAAGLWVYLKGDHTVIHNAMAEVTNGRMVTQEDAKAIMTAYMTMNKHLLVLSSLVTIGPGIVYFVYRIANGYARAVKGYRIANPKGWL